MTTNKHGKIYDAKLQVDEGKREVVAVINTEAIDRDREVVQPKGMKRQNYQGNPVVFWSHDYNAPVGKSLWIKPGQDETGRDVLISKTYFSDKTELSRDIFSLMQDGVLNAFSIGYQELRASPPTTKEINLRPELKNAKSIVREWELLEYSVVGIPANPEALTMAVSKGYSKETLKHIKGLNTPKAIEEIVVDIQKAEQKKFSSQELYTAVAKRLDQINFVVDADKVVAKALELLRSSVR